MRVYTHFKLVSVGAEGSGRCFSEESVMCAVFKNVLETLGEAVSDGQCMEAVLLRS